jgi:hypothetical protein
MRFPGPGKNPTKLSKPWKKLRKIFQSLESQIRTPFQVCEFGDANVSLE